MRRGTRTTPSQEDYLEAVLNLSEASKARIGDIAASVGVGKSSASLAVKALCEKGLLEHDSYGAVELTPEGRKLAEMVRRNHRAIMKFLVDQLRLPPEIAEKDACAMEHVVSPELVDRFAKFLEFTSLCPLGRAEWSEDRGQFQHDEEGGLNDECR
jgi:DtxR family Mn-dependent transcriptional regulator